MPAGAAFRNIRRRLRATQAHLGQVMGCSGQNVHLYERGQPVPPERARKLIAYAAKRGIKVTFDQIYGGQA